MLLFVSFRRSVYVRHEYLRLAQCIACLSNWDGVLFQPDAGVSCLLMPRLSKCRPPQALVQPFAERLPRRNRGGKRRGVKTPREQRPSLGQDPFDKSRELVDQRQQHGDADDVVGGMIRSEQRHPSIVFDARTRRGVTMEKATNAITAAINLKKT